MADVPDQKAFVKSLRDFVEKSIADKPPMVRMRRLNQALVAEVRSRLKKEMLVHPLAAVADESGKVNLIETDQNDSPEVLTQKLRDAAGDNQVFAASLCTLVERTSPRGETPYPLFKCIPKTEADWQWWQVYPPMKMRMQQDWRVLQDHRWAGT